MAEPELPRQEIELEEVDLESLRSQLEQRFLGGGPPGYVPGKTMIREAVAELLRCSDVEAENLVDTMESRDLIRYLGDLHGIDDLEHAWSFKHRA